MGSHPSRPSCSLTPGSRRAAGGGPPDLLPGPAWDLEGAEEITGEVYAIAEQLVLAPCAGRFLRPAVDDADESESLVNGEYLGVRDRVGDVIDTGDNIVPVASRHAGWLQGFLVPHGCPVRAAEPICWLSGRSAGKTVSGTENLADLCGEK